MWYLERDIAEPSLLCQCSCPLHLSWRQCDPCIVATIPLSPLHVQHPARTSLPKKVCLGRRSVDATHDNCEKGNLHTLHSCAWEVGCQVPRCPADAAANIQDPGRRSSAAPPEHLIHEVELGLLEVLLLVALRPLCLCVVTQVDVLTPVVLQYPIPACNQASSII